MVSRGGFQKHLQQRAHAVQVYRWFLGVYNVSVGVGLLGYGLLVLEVFAAASNGGKPLLPGGTAIVILWYDHVLLTFTSFQVHCLFCLRYLCS